MISEVENHQTPTPNRIIEDLVGLKGEGKYDHRNPRHAAIVTKAVDNLFYCVDTMVQLLELTEKTKKENHTETWDAFSRAYED